MAGHSNNQGKRWRVQELGFVHGSGHKLQDFKARMQEDVKELCSVLITTHEYNNKMQDGEQLRNIVEFRGVPPLIPLLQCVNRLGFEVCSVN